MSRRRRSTPCAKCVRGTRVRGRVAAKQCEHALYPSRAHTRYAHMRTLRPGAPRTAPQCVSCKKGVRPPRCFFSAPVAQVTERGRPRRPLQFVSIMAVRFPFPPTNGQRPEGCRTARAPRGEAACCARRRCGRGDRHHDVAAPFFARPLRRRPAHAVPLCATAASPVVRLRGVGAHAASPRQAAGRRCRCRRATICAPPLFLPVC